MTRIYTRGGDGGETGLVGGARARKDHRRIAAYGEVDELNAVLGLVRHAIEAARATGGDPSGDGELAGLDAVLHSVQHSLFVVGARLATLPADRERYGIPALEPSAAADLEGWIDGAESRLAPLRSFILPGGSALAAHLHHARTVCRRAERAVVHLAADEPVDPPILVFLNRLSDLLFVAARTANRIAGRPDAPWSPPRPSAAGASGG